MSLMPEAGLTLADFPGGQALVTTPGAQSKNATIP